METDAAFFEIFETNPDRLEELTGLDLPKFSSASSQAVKKTIQVECDLLFEPVSADDPEWIVEIQMYFDQAIFNRADLARAMVWKNRNPRKKCLLRGFQPKEVRGIVIFGDRTMLPPNSERHPHLEYLFLDELLDNLKNRSPNSPLIAVLAPLFSTDEELERDAAQHYDVIKQSPSLTPDERKILGEVFIHFITQRFETLNFQQILAMIAELTPIEKTVAGKELIEKGKQKGKVEGRKEGKVEGRKEGKVQGKEEERRTIVRKLIKNGMEPKDVARLMDLPIEEVEALLAG